MRIFRVLNFSPNFLFSQAIFKILWIILRKFYLNVIPLVIVHVIDIDPQLCPSETHSSHFVLKRIDPKSTWDYVMKQQLQKQLSSQYIHWTKNTTFIFVHWTYATQKSGILAELLFSFFWSTKLYQKRSECFIGRHEYRIRT